MKNTAAALCAILITMSSPAQAEPDLPPAALKRALEDIGMRVGVVRTIEGHTVRLEKFTVAPQGDWIVIRVKPRRVEPIARPSQ